MHYPGLIPSTTWSSGANDHNVVHEYGEIDRMTESMDETWMDEAPGWGGWVLRGGLSDDGKHAVGG